MHTKERIINEDNSETAQMDRSNQAEWKERGEIERIEGCKSGLVTIAN